MWIGQSQRATASGERIFQILDEPEDIADRPGAVELPPGAGDRVRRRALRLRPGAARCSRTSISRSRRDAERGADRPHGLGEDHADRARPALLRRDGGRVLIDGIDVRDVTLASLRRAIAVISQDPFLFSTTVRENIAFGARGRDRRGGRARPAARAGARVHRDAAGRLRHRHRRARHHAFGRPAPADRDRAGDRRSTRASSSSTTRPRRSTRRPRRSIRLGLARR